jgi:hypothetical protein
VNAEIEAARDKARKLLALAGSDNPNEAALAALAAARLITQHNLLDPPPTPMGSLDQIEALTGEMVSVMISYLAEHRGSVVGISSVLEAVLQRHDLTVPPRLEKKLYHKARWRLMGLVRDQLLLLTPNYGFSANPPTLKQLKKLSTKAVWK